jgi:hypothetical protein
MLLLLLSMSSAAVGALEHESSAATDASVVAPARCNGTMRYNGICEPLDFPPRMNCETQPSICSIVSRHFWPQTGAALHATVVMLLLGHWKLPLMAAAVGPSWQLLVLAWSLRVTASTSTRFNRIAPPCTSHTHTPTHPHTHTHTHIHTHTHTMHSHCSLVPHPPTPRYALGAVKLFKKCMATCTQCCTHERRVYSFTDGSRHHHRFSRRATPTIPRQPSGCHQHHIGTAVARHRLVPHCHH